MNDPHDMDPASWEARERGHAKPEKRIQRRARGVENNAFLTVRDRNFIVNRLEDYAKMIANARGMSIERNRVRKLIDKLQAITWSP